MHIAAAQIHAGGSVGDNLQRLERQARAAADVGADVILFAESALHGYDYGMTAATVRQVAESIDGPACSAVAELAATLNIAILAGFLERAGANFYNSVLVARPDGRRGVQRKKCLTTDEFDAGLAEGPAARRVFEFNGVRTVVIICADSAIEGLAEQLRVARVDYRFCPTGGGGKMADMLHASDLDMAAGRAAYARSRRNVFEIAPFVNADEKWQGIGFASANALGPAGAETCHQGHCMIVDNRGVVRRQVPGTIVLEHQQDQMIHAELAFD